MGLPMCKSLSRFVSVGAMRLLFQVPLMWPSRHSTGPRPIHWLQQHRRQEPPVWLLVARAVHTVHTVSPARLGCCHQEVTLAVLQLSAVCWCTKTAITLAPSRLPYADGLLVQQPAVLNGFFS